MPEKITDRQERIPGFRQSVIDHAKIAVLGAGRTANEVLKNLALVGFRTVFIVDMDTVSDTNLPGTALFTKRDVGEQKAALAAEGFSGMATAAAPVVDHLNTDICTGLGEGVLNQYDAIINCVDNLETRLYVARIAKLLGKPCIDTGIDGFDWTLFCSSGDTDTPCYACTMTAQQEADALVRVRNSCDVTLKKSAAQGRAATIITSASQVGGMAVDRLIKALHNMQEPSPAYDPRYGRMTIFQSGGMQLRGFQFHVRTDCDNHIRYEDFGGIRKTPLSADNTLEEVLTWASQHCGQGYYLSILKDCAKITNRAFIAAAKCKHCGAPINVYRPQFTLHDEDLLCEACMAAKNPPVQPSEAVPMYRFDWNAEPKLLAMPLRALGIPPLHIIELDPIDEEQLPLFLELDGDLPAVLPNLAKAEG